ncbi:outer membrane lipoprotein carrier protein LolA [Sphingomonas sinipercae]|uniref:Outer membrane lipoprotein carrier protein LolA n=1 Tax=Sphingomonas sinipercae TaxID=2714944 RepID=A0A6G7ZKR6_9SPHN|nr:outer membrane lipoprotein carrier protein LolA [Sphingomonas sinipercae]QIL01571.1 outer membrane lipoprotein carrier protein LolA [Sphingomonas sinipercae]
MSFANSIARALIPVTMLAVPATAVAATSPDLAKVQAHLNAVNSMTANFVQTDGKGRQMSGTLQLKRPGKIRFEYGRGANMLLVSNGGQLTFLDYEVGQKSSWPLGKTPLGMLLADNPQVAKFAKIVPSNDPRVLVVRATRQPYGTLILAFTRSGAGPGGLQLYGWTAVDPQNKRTTVKLSNVRYNVGVSESAFSYAEPTKRKR